MIKVRYPDVPLDRFVMVGDPVADIAFARNTGIRSCRADHGYGDPIAGGAASPDHVVRSMEEPTVLLWRRTLNEGLEDF